MEERGLIGIEARDAGGEELGRISEMVTDEESGEVTHVIVERGGDSLEVPIARITLDPEADFAMVNSVPSDDEPQGYAPADTASSEEPQDYEHEGQLVAEPESVEEAGSEEDVAREDWEDEASTPADSGYPRTDAYIDPETGEATEGYPEAADGAGLQEAVGQILEDTGLQAVSVEEGVVVLAGRAGRDELDRIAADLLEVEEVFDVDTGGVTVG